jgi:hypothetical protein
MRSIPNDKYDDEELAQLNAEPWMIDLLKLNPDYTCWGPYEDYMAGDGGGWSASKREQSWEEIKGWTLNDWNEMVNFYFEVSRASKRCEECAGTGYHRDALWVSESFYSHSSPFCYATDRELAAKKVMEQFSGKAEEPLGRGTFPTAEVIAKYGPEFERFCYEMVDHREWRDRITQDEVEALAERDRLFNYMKKGDPIPSAAVVNAAQGRGAFLGHDGINRCILIEQRCKRFGIPLHCETCDGSGYVYTAPKAHVNLILWYLHPRKGCSRGVEVRGIKQAQLPEVFAYLRKAAKRNADRFGKIPA